MNEQSNPVVILGAYQSGTSVLAGCLRLLGVNLGPSLGAADESEEARDYPENSSIILIHDILLRDLGCRWDMIGTLPENWLQSRAAATAREKIENLIEREFASSAPWAISDPRLCKLLPLWLDIFSEEGLTPRIVFMVRHPYEVAVSLQNRHGFDLLKGHLLWLSSNRQALSRLREYEHAIITYDRLLADPVSCLETIGRELNLSFPLGLADGYQDLIAYIRPELKHAYNSHADTGEKGKNIFAHYAWLYDQFRLNETRYLASPAQTQASDEAVFSAKTAVQNLAVFPLVPKAPKAQKTAVDTSHAAEMFDNLLGLIRSYEQAELNTEIKRQRLLLEADHQEPMLYAQICLPSADNDQNMPPSENTKKILLAPEEWQKISMEINNPDVLRQNRLRFDPLNTRGMIRIQSLALINAATDQAVWSAPDSAGFDQCSVEGQALVLDRQEGLVMCATGNTPRIFLPAFPDLPDAPLRFEVWLKAGRNLDQITDLWTQKDQTIKKLKTEIEATQKQLEEKEEILNHREEKKKTELEAEKQSLEQYLEEKEEHKQQLAIEVEEKAQEAQENARKAKSRAEEINRLQEKIARQDEAFARNEQELKHIREKLADRESDLERLRKDFWKDCARIYRNPRTSSPARKI